MSIIKVNDINQAIQDLKSDKPIAFLTDTIYGLSSDIFSKNAVDNLFHLKGRPEGKPLIVLIPKGYQVEQLVEVNDLAKKLMNTFWPGPLTIIFKTKATIAPGITPYNTLSLRMPDDTLTQTILTLYQKPITSTSANLSGEAVLNDPISIARTFPTITVINSGIREHSAPSTIVDISGDQIKYLRIGAITREEIENVIHS